MKYDYLFVDTHNGHEITYHPFSCNSAISQKLVTKLLNQIPGAGRLGTSVVDLMCKLDENKYEIEHYICKCCGQKTLNISGNY